MTIEPYFVRFFVIIVSMSRKIILIGGAPTVGKSTIAKALSARLNLPWISTDQIRTILQVAADRDKCPTLFTSDNLCAEDFLNKYSAQEIAKMEYQQGVDVWPGIKAMISNDWTWRDGCIIEGVNIIPKLIAEEYGDKPNIKTIILSDKDEDRIRSVVYTRGLFGKADGYSDDVKEKEVDWVLLFDKAITDEADKYGNPVVDIRKNDEDISRVLRALDV